MQVLVAQLDKGPRPKHVPQRICVACRQSGSKRGLVRVVRTPGGDVQVDLSGKVAGRGAYLCRSKACWNIALKKRAVEQVLHTTLKPAEKLGLEQFANSLPE